MSIRDWVSARSRNAKLEHFYSLCPHNSTVLDVGVTGSWRRRDPIPNWFLQHYRFDPWTYTGFGITKMDMVRREFPAMRFVQYDGKTMPFEDDAFDWVFSNAVIEHVGDTTAQERFLREMLRVGRNVFFTTPNRFFPVEVHTSKLFVHWGRS